MSINNDDLNELLRIATIGRSSIILENRRRKLSKITDKINGIEHKYIESDVDYFTRKLMECSKIPKKYFNI